MPPSLRGSPHAPADDKGYAGGRLLSLKVLHLQGNRLNGLLPVFFKFEEFRTVAVNLADNDFWCPLPAWPALNNTASCRHCPNDLYLDDPHRTCSDHGVCIDGESCRCDPRWTGETCSELRCTPAEANFSTCHAVGTHTSSASLLMHCACDSGTFASDMARAMT